MKELEEKILAIINKVEELYSNKRYELPHVRHKIMAKEIAALIEPVQEKRICIHKDGANICYNGNTDYHLCPGSCSEAEYPVEQPQQKYEGFWWCPGCKKRVQPIDVTFEETHEDCGYQVIWKEQIIEQSQQVELPSDKLRRKHLDSALKNCVDTSKLDEE